MFKTIFCIAVGVVGLIEWLKNFLPAKVKDNKAILATISGIVSVVAGACYVPVVVKVFGSTTVAFTWQNCVIYAVGTLGLVQTSYTLLFQTFKAVVTRLKEKYSVPADVVSADEIADTVADKVEAAIAEATSKKK